MTTTADPQHIAEVVDSLKERLGGDEPAPPAPPVAGGAWVTPSEPSRAHPHRRPASAAAAAAGRLWRRTDVRIAAAGTVLAAGVTLGLRRIR